MGFVKDAVLQRSIFMFRNYELIIISVIHKQCDSQSYSTQHHPNMTHSTDYFTELISENRKA